MPAWLWLVLIAAAVYGLHRLALWAESRGWIYYMKSRGYSTRAGSAMLEVQQLFEPSKKHIIEIKRDQRGVEDDQGDPPGPDEAA